LSIQWDIADLSVIGEHLATITSFFGPVDIRRTAADAHRRSGARNLVEIF
jgi:hypothetical protein